MWGIIPAAGAGSRIQPLAFSKELLPVGCRRDGESERPRAVSEYLLERMILAGADHICFVISPGKYDILQYYGASYGGADLVYVVQQRPGGLCQALFQAASLIRADEQVLLGLPDTIWFPEDGLAHLRPDVLALLTFPVDRPHLFDAVVCDDQQHVRRIQVKHPQPDSDWIWGAMRMPGAVFGDLHALWRQRECADEYLGTLINAYLDAGGQAVASPVGRCYVDVGTLNGYREAVALLSDPTIESGI